MLASLVIWLVKIGHDEGSEQLQRRPNTQTVQWFLEMDASGQLDLDPQYQRRSVWNEEYRRFYIDTVLRNYPSPAIYLAIETRAGSPTLHHVIDGKQRLETLIGFTKGEFHLASYLDDLGFTSPYFEDLSETLRDALVDYVLSVENITRSTPAEIKSAFERLNRNTAKLNRQELRKAQYEGAFITKMTNLAEHPFWTSIGLATRARISRMLDVEYVSEIYLLTGFGVLDGNPNLLDDYYALFDDEVPNEDETLEQFYRIVEWLDSLQLPWASTRWNNLGDFYGLWAAAISLDANGGLPDADQSARRLVTFGMAMDQPSTEAELRYSDAVRQGSNKVAARQTRAAILTELLRA